MSADRTGHTQETCRGLSPYEQSLSPTQAISEAFAAVNRASHPQKG
jgi:hypothetical protein